LIADVKQIELAQKGTSSVVEEAKFRAHVCFLVYFVAVTEVS
jgi:hypothetical protein